MAVCVEVLYSVFKGRGFEMMSLSRRCGLLHVVEDELTNEEEERGEAESRVVRLQRFVPVYDLVERMLGRRE